MTPVPAYGMWHQSTGQGSGATRIGTSHTAAILNGVPVDFSPT
jgi:hypothetical protein